MLPFPLATTDLARRIERAGVDDMCAWLEDSRRQETYPDAECFHVGGGVALWFSPGNVVNGAYGLGLHGLVEQEEVAALSAFFAERGAQAKIDVCPHADASLLRWCAESGFVATGFETVLYQPLPAALSAPLADGVEVRLASSSEERELWADLEARGFTDESPTEDHRVLARSIALRAAALPFIGYLEGEPSGTGMLNISDGVAMFNGDSTLPRARGRGVQTSVLAERLRYAADAGCEIAVIEAEPSGTSQRNQLRAGFRIAYTRVQMELPVRA
ncbi:MAG: hypothetical protein EG823_01945 [Actinobacteria bacterium]|nr:hypothetical protein [Actinomycetota bacterium]